MLSLSTRQQSDITQCYTVRKQLATLSTLKSTLVGYLSFFRECGNPNEGLGSVSFILLEIHVGL